jgi:integrase
LVDYVDRSGKRHQTVVRGPDGRSTRELAEARLDELREEQKKRLKPRGRRRKFSELAEVWLAEQKKHVRAKTHGDYERILRLRLLPKFGELEAMDIGVEEIQQLQSEMAETLHPLTNNKTLVVLSMILSSAVATKELDANPCDHVRRLADPDKEVDPETGEVMEGAQRTLTKPQLASLLAASREIAEEARRMVGPKDNRRAIHRRFIHPHWCYHTLLVVAAETGLRRSELFGLWWEDIDTNLRTVRVRRACIDGTFGKPKSEESRRTVELTTAAVSALQAWRLRTPFKNPRHLAFCTDKGGPLSGNKVTAHVRAAAKRAKLEEVGLHTLRHTYGSHLLAAGEDLATVSAALGHASITITADVYLHDLKKAPGAIAGKLEAFRAAG